MRQVSYTLIDHVRAPIDAVFAALTDPRCVERWLPGCSAVLAPGPVHKGAKLKAQFGARTSEFDIVDFQPPYTFGWVERGQRRNSKTFFRLDRVEATTAVTIRQVWTPPSLGAWVRGHFFPRRNVQRHSKTIVDALRALLSSERPEASGPESGTPQGP